MEYFLLSLAEHRSTNGNLRPAKPLLVAWAVLLKSVRICNQSLHIDSHVRQFSWLLWWQTTVVFEIPTNRETKNPNYEI